MHARGILFFVKIITRQLYGWSIADAARGENVKTGFVWEPGENCASKEKHERDITWSV
jgi:hypothetical protein